MNKLKNIIDFDIFEFAKYNYVELDEIGRTDFYNRVDSELTKRYRDIRNNIQTIGSEYRYYYFLDNNSKNFMKRINFEIHLNFVKVNIKITNPHNLNLKAEMLRDKNHDINFNLYKKDEDGYFDKLFIYIDKELIAYNNSDYRRALINFDDIETIDRNEKIKPYMDYLRNEYNNPYFDNNSFIYLTADTNIYNLVDTNARFTILELLINKSDYRISFFVNDIKSDKYEMKLEIYENRNHKLLKEFKFRSLEFVDTVEECMKFLIDYLKQ
jgi:hypothetical protein